MKRLLLTLLLVYASGLAAPCHTAAQTESDPPQTSTKPLEPDSSSPNSNGKLPRLIGSEDFETAQEEGSFENWEPMGKAALTFDDSEAFKGKASGKIDSRKLDSSESESPFSGATWELDAEPLRGQRVRYSAYVKVADVEGTDRVFLWVRGVSIDDDGNFGWMGFDNMSKRPIQSTEWTRYELVIDVAEDADKYGVGFVVGGQAVGWIDEAKVEVVDSSVEITGLTRRTAGPSPFFTGWLWLVVLGLVLFSLAYVEYSIIQRFCLRFSILYWLIYLLPWLVMLMIATLQTLGTLGVPTQFAIGWARGCFDGFYGFVNPVAQWTSTYLLGIEGSVEYVAGGSGDTTFDYVHIFNCFLISLIGAFVWTLLPFGNGPNGKHHNEVLTDLHRTFLRYCVAICIFGYGVAKAGFVSTQFAPTGTLMEGQLTRTYGESSPMGLLWTFMAASPMYTFFGGTMEVIPALLLVFRRTALLGAMMTCAVMTNVFVLNLCYDVPVKQFSFHLTVAGILLLLPEASRLWSFLIWNRTVEPSKLLRPPYATSNVVRRLHLVAKFVVVILAFVIPLGQHGYKELTHEFKPKSKSEHLLLKKSFRWISEAPDNR